MSNTVDSDDEESTLDLFLEPQGYYEPEKPATFTEYTLQNGHKLPLRLVGSNPLWGHLLWNAGKIVATYLEDNVSIVRGKTVLELGAGAGLPSIVSAVLGAHQVVVTDYPDADLIENLQINIKRCIPDDVPPKIYAEGYLWGNDTSTLTSHLGPNRNGFDVLILADILFNHSEHDKLVQTVKSTMKRGSDSTALVFFTPYRPWLLENDMNFFEVAKVQGLMVHKLFEHKLDKVMFEDDPGDETLRRTVFGFEVKWP